jgi:hypothetical protein
LIFSAIVFSSPSRTRSGLGSFSPTDEIEFAHEFKIEERNGERDKRVVILMNFLFPHQREKLEWCGKSSRG